MAAILLIGSHGFAGRHFRAEACSAGLDVVCAARGARSGEQEVDLLDAGSVERLVREAEPDAVVNLAGAASVAESWRDPLGSLRVNCLGVANLLEAVAAHAPAAHVLCLSSAEVYGAVTEDGLPVAEDHTVEPVNPYGASKAAMEVLSARYGRVPGLAITVARAFNHVGPGQDEAFSSSSFARQIAEAERAGATEVVLKVGDVRPVRDFMDVRDTVRAYRVLVERKLTGTFNICSEAPTALWALIDLLDAQTPLEVKVQVDKTRVRPVDVPALYGSCERLRNATGWAPEIPLEQTMADLLQWWRRRLAT